MYTVLYTTTIILYILYMYTNIDYRLQYTAMGSRGEGGDHRRRRFFSRNWWQNALKLCVNWDNVYRCTYTVRSWNNSVNVCVCVLIQTHLLLLGLASSFSTPLIFWWACQSWKISSAGQWHVWQHDACCGSVVYFSPGLLFSLNTYSMHTRTH